MSQLTGMWTETSHSNIEQEAKERLLVKWRLDPYHNPINGRPIKPNTKVWKQLKDKIGDPLLLVDGPTDTCDPISIENIIAEQQRKSDAGQCSYITNVTNVSGQTITSYSQAGTQSFNYQTSAKHTESALVFLSPPTQISLVQPRLPQSFDRFLPRHKVIDGWGC